jgi:hypothetical protein
MVDLSLEPRLPAPMKASRRIAILLFVGLLSLVAVIIITMAISKRGGELLGMECNNAIVGYTGGHMTLTGAGGHSPIHEIKYDFVIREFRIPLPAALGRILVDGSRCG